MNTSRLGNIGEAKLLWELVKRQIPTYTQFGDSEKVDIIAEFNGKLNKIQVKTSDSLKECKGNTTFLNYEDYLFENIMEKVTCKEQGLPAKQIVPLEE